jgi:hypothetical protein
MAYVQSVMIVLLVNQASIATAVSGERTIVHEPAAIIGQEHSGKQPTKNVRMTPVTPLDRVATAVDGAESRSRDVAPKSLRASRADAGGRGGGYGCRRRGSI